METTEYDEDQLYAITLYEYPQNTFRVERFFTYDQYGNVKTDRVVFFEDNEKINKKKGDIRNDYEYFYTYDAEGRITSSYSTCHKWGGTSIEEEYLYDDDGNLAEIQNGDYGTEYFTCKKILVYRGE